jgi:hypothetical protein
MTGLYCVNFAHSRGHWPACKQVWCGSCYTTHALDRFPKHEPVDEEGFNWKPAEEQLRYTQARDGDFLLAPFQCDLCVFRNLQGRNPTNASLQDEMLLCCIRRINLDAVWGRETSTVAATLRSAKTMLRTWQLVGLTPSFPALGPYPVEDSFGYGVAIAMVLKSLDPGRYADHQQFESIRKMRATFSNIFMSSKRGTDSLRSFGGDRAKHVLTDSPTNSLFFERFCQGCVRRMGQEVRQNWAIPLPVIHALLDLLEKDWSFAQTEAEKEVIGLVGAFTVIAFCGSFRGNEVFLADLHGTKKYLESPEVEDGVIIIPLLGRSKGETGDRYHLTPLAATTSSGIQVKLWVSRLVATKAGYGQVRGPLFSTRRGILVSPNMIETELMDRLQGIKDSQGGLIPADVDVLEDFGISRSFRRGATSTARIRGVDDKHVTLINRWRVFENAKGRRPTLAMKDHYSDIQILLPELVKFSLAL